MGVCISQHTSLISNQIQSFEKQFPLTWVPLQEYENRVKRLVFEGDEDQITLKQLAASFKGCHGFEDLEDPSSFWSIVFKSRHLQLKKGEDTAPGDLQGDPHPKIWVSALILLGILYCKATDYIKAVSFYNLLQGGLNEFIAANDKELVILCPLLMKLATIFTAHYAVVLEGKHVSEIDDQRLEEKMDGIFEELHEQLLDKLFDTSTRISREEFIEKMSSDSLRVYLCPKEIRVMVDKKKVEKGLDKSVSEMLVKADNSAHGQVEQLMCQDSKNQ